MISSATKQGIGGALFATCIAFGLAPAAQAVPTSVLVYKMSDSAQGVNAVDANLTWDNAGGFNESNGAAQLLLDNGLDYKNSFVDTSWGSVLGVRVAMYNGGVQQAFIDFSPGTTKTNFFTAADVTASSYTSLSPGGNFFSIDGDAGNQRHWFINNNYGGCGSDTGNWVVLDRGGPCSWQTDGEAFLNSNDRGFLYSLATSQVNWNSGFGAGVGVADVYAVFVTVDVPVAEPASLALFGIGGLAMAAVRRRSRG